MLSLDATFPIGSRMLDAMRLLLLVSIGIVLLLGSGVLAQESTATKTPARPERRGRLLIDDRAQQFAKKLGLNESQELAVKKILEQQQQEILRIRSTFYGSGSARIGQLRAVQSATVERIRAVLTEEQKAKYNPLAVRQIPPGDEQRTVEDWLKASRQK